MGNPEEWVEILKQCKYLPEQDLKELCEMVTFISSFPSWVVPAEGGGLLISSFPLHHLFHEGGIMIWSHRVIGRCGRMEQWMHRPA